MKSSVGGGGDYSRITVTDPPKNLNKRNHKSAVFDHENPWGGVVPSEKRLDKGT